MVEIIPRPVEEVDRWQKILIYLFIFLVIVSIGGYFLLASFQKSSEVYIEELEIRLTQGRTSERTVLEQESLNYKKKIEAISPFLEAHLLGSKFFEFLENNTHPRIFFSKLNLSIEESRAILSGNTDSFSTLEQQLSVFNQDDLIENLSLTRVFLNKEGRIDFDLEILLKTTIFKY